MCDSQLIRCQSKLAVHRTSGIVSPQEQSDITAPSVFPGQINCAIILMWMDLVLLSAVFGTLVLLAASL